MLKGDQRICRSLFRQFLLCFDCLHVTYFILKITPEIKKIAIPALEDSVMSVFYYALEATQIYPDRVAKVPLDIWFFVSVQQP